MKEHFTEKHIFPYHTKPMTMVKAFRNRKVIQTVKIKYLMELSPCPEMPWVYFTQ